MEPTSWSKDGACLVQVDLFGRQNLGPATAGAATLDPHHRADRRLAQGHGGIVPLSPQRLGQAILNLLVTTVVIKLL